MDLSLSLLTLVGVLTTASATELRGSSGLSAKVSGLQAAAKVTCPSGSSANKVEGAPVCVCAGKAHWVKNRCKTGKLKNAAYLDALNAARVPLGSTTMTWNKKAAKAAQTWVNTLRSRNCAFEHPTGPYPWGQNLYMGSDGSVAPASVSAWLSEAPLYKRAVFPNGCKGGWFNCGHYTQVIWNGSTTVGCASTTCADKFTKIVSCNFFPPGNVVGFYPYN